jgi:hypothetical protein
MVGFGVGVLAGVGEGVMMGLELECWQELELK